MVLERRKEPADGDKGADMQSQKEKKEPAALYNTTNVASVAAEEAAN